MKKVTVQWTEFHNYEAEIEIPEAVDEIDWVINNTDDWGMGLREPYEINTDWDSFYIEEIK